MKALSDFPRYDLGVWPTPLMRLRRLEEALGAKSPRIWMKRDDLTGLAFGGNKTRKLEYLVADAIWHRATVLVTEGGVQSNHARLTAAAANLAGLKAVLVLDMRRQPELQGNLLLDEMMGAEVHLVRDPNHRREIIEWLVPHLREQGEAPYFIPTGGSVPVGALGYVQAMFEMHQQFRDSDIEPRRLYSPTGSQGTLAGLMAGRQLAGIGTEIYGVAVEYPREELVESAEILLGETLSLLESDAGTSVQDVVIDDGFVGEGYGIPSKAGQHAITLLARSEAIFLDPVYSAKAMSALIAHVQNGDFDSEQDVVFLHTGGGPSIFAYASEIGAGLETGIDAAGSAQSAL